MTASVAKLLERDRELQVLDECMASTIAGEGRLVIISGEPGVGKTALAKQMCGLSRASARVLWGQCDPLDTPRALGPVLDIARSAGGSLAELAATDDRYSLFTEFVSVWTNDSSPTVVVLDDVQWADAATLDFLSFAGRRVDLTRCLLLVTCREEVGRDHPLRGVLGELATSGRARRLRLEPLSEKAVAELAAPTGWDAAEVHRLSGGVPFVVSELLAAPPGVVASVNDTVLARASQLDPAAREVLDAAALLPEGASVTMLTSTLDQSEQEIDACVAAGLLAYEGDAIGFRHDLARQAIVDAMSPARRSRLHHRILAGLLETAGVDPAVCAHHAELAGDPGVVLRFAPVAARRASALGAHREAAAQYERSLRFAGGLPDEGRAALLDAYAAELRVLDRPAEALEASTDALSCWRASGDRAGLGASLRRRVEILRYADDPDAAAAAGAAAIEVLEPGGESLELARAYAVVAQSHMLLDETGPALEAGHRGLEIAARFDDEETNIHLLTTVGVTRMSAGDLDGLPMLEDALSRARAAGLDEAASRAWTNLVDFYAVIRRPADALRHSYDGLSFSHSHDLTLWAQCIRTETATALVDAGRFDEAVETAKAVFAIDESSRRHRVWPLVAMARVRSRRGEANALELLDEALVVAERLEEPQLICPTRAARAEAAWLTGDLDLGAKEARVGLDLVPPSTRSWLASELALWLSRCGEPPASTEGLTEPFRLHVEGQHARAAALWHERGCVYDEADALADSDSEVELRRAFAILDALGAKPRLAMVTQRLKDLGVRNLPRPNRGASRTSRFGLTPREIEVAACLGEHMTNDEIAARLFISPKTVDHHVSSILLKVGATTRREAARHISQLESDGGA